MELLQIADSVAREKNIDRDIVIEAMEDAIQKAGRTKYGHDHDIRAYIDRKNGNLKLMRYREVCAPEDIVNETSQITLEQAQKEKSDTRIGDFLSEELPHFDYGRIAAQTAKQVIVQKVRDAERERQYEEFKDRVGEIVNGTVKRIEYGNITVDLGRAEALLRRDECIPRERFEQGNRVRSYIHDVRPEPRGPQIFLSRTHPDFLIQLFHQEVPEIYDGIIEVKSAARDPGSRAKIAVLSHDSSIDPVGACVGMRGSRVQAIVNELQGEKIDIVPWSEDVASFTIQALAPAAVAKVVLDERNKRMDVVVPDDQLSLAIGRRGQNVRLASILTGWDIDVLTEEEESERRSKEFQTRSALFIETLDVDEVIAQLLVAEGFTSIEEIAETDTEELQEIEGFDEDVAAELKERAVNYIETQANALKEKQQELGIAQDLLDLEGVTPDIIIKLGENGVTTRDDLADLATDELVEVVGENLLTRKQAETLIMNARAHWFAEEQAEEQTDSDTESESEQAQEAEKAASNG